MSVAKRCNDEKGIADPYMGVGAYWGKKILGNGKTCKKLASPQEDLVGISGLGATAIIRYEKFSARRPYPASEKTREER